jgi:hypothetical protein
VFFELQRVFRSAYATETSRTFRFGWRTFHDEHNLFQISFVVINNLLSIELFMSNGNNKKRNRSATTSEHEQESIDVETSSSNIDLPEDLLT